MPGHTGTCRRTYSQLAGRTWTTSPAETGTGGSPGRSAISSRPPASTSVAVPVSTRPSGSSARTGWPRVAHSATVLREQAGPGRVRVRPERGVPALELAEHRGEQLLPCHRGALGEQRGGRQAGRRHGQRLRGSRDVEADADHHRRLVRRLLGEDARQLALADQDVVRPLEHRVDAAHRPDGGHHRDPGKQRQPAAPVRAAPSPAAAARRTSAPHRARSTRTGRAGPAPPSAPPRRAPGPRGRPARRRPARAGRRWSSRWTPPRQAGVHMPLGAGRRSPQPFGGLVTWPSRRSRSAAGGSPCPCSPP